MSVHYRNVYSNPDVSLIPYIGLYKHDTREVAVEEGRLCEALNSGKTKFLYTIKVTPK